MLQTLSRNWWALALRGVIAILFGVLALIWPGLTLWALVLLFGAYAFVDGIFSLVSAFRGRRPDVPWWWLLLEGIAGIGAGIIAFLWPGMTAFALVYLIAAWAVVTGIFEIVTAIRLRKEIEGEWLLVVSGVLSVLFGITVFFWPGAGALAIVWLIGAYAILFGVLMVILAFRVRNLAETYPDRMPRPAA
jgi:uncharacterized membrane protein HdeD (DUF308 family)